VVLAAVAAAAAAAIMLLPGQLMFQVRLVEGVVLVEMVK